MRFKFLFTLENEKFPIQYRKSIMSFIKMSLQEYNEETFDNLYHEKDPIMKPYTFSVFFKNPKFQEDSILLEDKKVELNFSIQDYNIAINIYNGFNHQIHKAFPLAQNFMTLQKISIIPEKQIKTDEIMVKFMSPLVVREHNNETKKDYYYSFQHEEFEEMLKINIREEMKNTDIPERLIETFSIEAINAKKTVIKFYEKQIEASLGIYKLKGSSELLDYLYKAGIGSKRSSGFGMFTII